MELSDPKNKEFIGRVRLEDDAGNFLYLNVYGADYGCQTDGRDLQHIIENYTDLKFSAVEVIDPEDQNYGSASRILSAALRDDEQLPDYLGPDVEANIEHTKYGLPWALEGSAHWNNLMSRTAGQEKPVIAL